MRLVWIILPLFLFSIVGIQESFAEQASGKPAWEVGSDKVCGDKLCSEESVHSDENKNYFYKLPLEFGEINIPYKIDNGTIKDIIFDKGGSLIINLEPVGDGILAIDIEKISRFIKLGFGELSDTFLLLDGEEQTFDYNDDEDKKEIIFSFTEDSSSAEIIPISMETMMPSGPLSWYRHELLEYDHLFPPTKQTANGINPKDVKCNDGLELIFKLTDGSSACVKPKTTEKLIQRGWASN